MIVQKRQNRLEVKVGTLVDFPCFVTHSKLSSVSFQWKRNNVIIVSDNNTQFISGDQGVTLIIESTSHSNDGVYQCIVSTFSSEAVLAPEVAYTTTELIVTGEVQFGTHVKITCIQTSHKSIFLVTCMSSAKIPTALADLLQSRIEIENEMTYYLYLKKR